MLNRRLFIMAAGLLLLTGSVFAQFGSIEGVVLLPDNAGPAVGATVVVYGEPPMDSTVATTNDQGHFTIDSIAGGPKFARAMLPGYLPGTGGVFVQPGHIAHLTLLLRHEPTGFGIVRGVVLLPMQGGPAAGATVWLFRAPHDSMVTTADDSGRFVFDSAAIGLHDLHASLPGYLGAHIQVRVLDGETVHVVLLLRPLQVPTFGNIAGHVFVGNDSTPAEGATVTLFFPPRDSLVMMTDAGGQFAFDSLPTGPYEVRVTLDGYLPVFRPVPVRPNQTTPVNVILHPVPTAVVMGSVLFADNTPVPGASVILGWHQPRHPFFHTRTDSLGHFSFIHVPAGHYLIRAALHEQGFVEQQIDVADGQTVEVTLVLGDSTGSPATRSPDSPQVADNVNTLPIKQFIANNYPNPFNPTTMISYSVPTASFVRLSVYDVLGRKVADLVNGYRDAGSYNVSFNGENLPSGIYLYRFTAGNFSHTGRMTLLK
jgi:hypothetical protein